RRLHGDERPRRDPARKAGAARNDQHAEGDGDMEWPDDQVRPASEAAPEAAAAGTTPEPSVPGLKAEIAQTREEMQETIAEIQERLSPSHLAEQAKTTVREATMGRVANMAERAGQTASAVATQTRRAANRLPRPVRDNPLPLALIGAGVVWL